MALLTYKQSAALMTCEVCVKLKEQGSKQCICLAWRSLENIIMSQNGPKIFSFLVHLQSNTVFLNHVSTENFLNFIRSRIIIVFKSFKYTKYQTRKISSCLQVGCRPDCCCCLELLPDLEGQ